MAGSGASIYIYPTPTLLFSEDFNSGYANWTLKNLITPPSLVNGITFAVSGGNATWTAAHTATSNQSVANNNLLTNSNFSDNDISLIFNLAWTDPTANNAQFEGGIWWTSNDRIYYGNNLSTNGSFISIKIGGVDIVFDSSFAQNTNAYIMIRMNRTTNRVSFYTWLSSTWVVLSQNIDTSALSVPNTPYKLFFAAGGEQNTRTGGDTGSSELFYLYGGPTNINPTTL